MPNLSPDLSIYPRPQQQSPGGLIDLLRGVQGLQSQQSMTEALKGATDPATGDVDVNKAREAFTAGGGFKDPAQYGHLIELQNQQMAAQLLQKRTAAGIFGRLADLPNPTPRDVARAQTEAAGLLPPSAAQMINDMATKMGPLGSDEWRKNIVTLKNTFGGGLEEGYTTIQTPVGPRSVPKGQATQMAQQPGGIATEAGGDEAWKVASDRMANYKPRVQPLEQAVAILNRMPEGSTYPGAEGANRIKTFLIANAPEMAKTIKGLDPNNVKDFTELHKYLTDWTNQVSLGMHSSDAAMYSAVAANPSVSMHLAAARDVAKVRLGTERMQHALSQEFARSGLAPAQFNTWQARNANALDPRAFVFDTMTNEQRDRLTASIAKRPAEWRKFKDSLKLAEKYELTSPKAGWGTE